MTADTDSTMIARLEFELEKAEHGMALPYDAERVRDLRKMLVEARKRKVSQALAQKQSLQGREPKAGFDCIYGHGRLVQGKHMRKDD